MKKQKSPLCPKCGSERVGWSYTSEEERLECQLCNPPHLFEPPEHMKGRGPSKKEKQWRKEREGRSISFRERGTMKERTSEDLTQQEVDLLMRFAQGMAERIQSFHCPDPFDPNSPPDYEREYLGLWFDLAIQSDALLELCQSFIGSSPNRMLRNVEWFAENILALENPGFHPNDKTRMKWAAVAREVVQDILGIRKDAGVIRQRNETIRRLRLLLGKSHKKICEALDLDEELRQNDPLLKKWQNEVLDPRLGYQDALKHPVLENKAKKMISTA